jgi:hypothetical protein
MLSRLKELPETGTSKDGYARRRSGRGIGTAILRRLSSFTRPISGVVPQSGR